MTDVDNLEQLDDAPIDEGEPVALDADATVADLSQEDADVLDEQADADEVAADAVSPDEPVAPAAADDEQAAPAAAEGADVIDVDAADVDAADVDATDVDPAGDGAEELADPVDAETLLEEDAEPEPEEISPYDRPGKWYVVHTQSGYENKVRQNLEARTQSMNMEGRIHETVIPTEEVVEFKNGRKVVVQRKVFPGYLLVRCNLDDDSWYVIRNTPGVTGFVGAGNKPSPLRRNEVEQFLQVKPAGQAPIRKGKPKLEYEMGETVRVKEGPFADFSGQIVEINEDQLKVKVLVNIFGRETPVELEFSQIARL
jgi:transcription termination/antitermination protein NusG